MSLSTRTAIATVLRRVAQGFITKSEAYHLISEIYFKELNHA